MAAPTSACFRPFGHADFDPARLSDPLRLKCTVQGCSATLHNIAYGTQQDREGRPQERSMPWCSEHGIRLHSNTFVYWNGDGLEDKARLRNFIVQPELVRAIALPKGMKAEAHRLGYEMSEDALSWNVFVSLAVAARLRDSVQYLTDKRLRSEPSLYLWGRHIDLHHGDFSLFPELARVRELLEKGIRRFPTEPDIMLIAPGEMVICIEAKFGSGNPLAHDSVTGAGEKPTTRQELLDRYLTPSEYARRSVQPPQIAQRFHSQLFRNIVFACEMARELPWHVVNLVSATQRGTADEVRDSFVPPTEDVRCYLHPDRQHCFTYRTWEGLHAALIRDDVRLGELDRYLRGKSAHYRRAFELS
jgi:hypothetical protein